MVNPTQVPVSGPLAEFVSGFAALTSTSASVLISVAWERGGNSESHRLPRGWSPYYAAGWSSVPVKRQSRNLPHAAKAYSVVIRSWPLSRRFDYADSIAVIAICNRGWRRKVGIIRRSA